MQLKETRRIKLTESLSPDSGNFTKFAVVCFWEAFVNDVRFCDGDENINLFRRLRKDLNSSLYYLLISRVSRFFKIHVFSVYVICEPRPGFAVEESADKNC